MAAQEPPSPAVYWSKDLPASVDQIVRERVGASQNIVGELFDTASCGPVYSGSVNRDVHEARVGDRTSDFTDQQTFSGLDVCDLVDDAP